MLTLREFLTKYNPLLNTGAVQADTVFVLTYPNGTKTVVKADLNAACAMFTLSPIGTVFKMVCPCKYPSADGSMGTLYVQRIDPTPEMHDEAPQSNWRTMDEFDGQREVARLVARKHPTAVAPLSVESSLGACAIMR